MGRGELVKRYFLYAFQNSFFQECHSRRLMGGRNKWRPLKGAILKALPRLGVGGGNRVFGSYLPFESAKSRRGYFTLERG